MDWRARMEEWQRHHVMRNVLFGLGVTLIIASPVIGAIPGPGGLFVFAAGLALTLRNSRWAKRRYVHFKRRFPKQGDWADWGLRRASARRRRDLAKARPEDMEFDPRIITRRKGD